MSAYVFQHLFLNSEVLVDRFAMDISSESRTMIFNRWY